MRFLSSGYSCVLSMVIIMLAGTSPMSGQANQQPYAEYMTAATQLGWFNGYVVVARDGEPIFSQGYGRANFEDDVANTSRTKYRLASITKTFTAVAIMMLQEKGSLAVSDPVCKYLAECPAAWKPVTIRHVLGHTAGIADYAAAPDFMSRIGLPTAPDALMATVRPLPLQFGPGSNFAYSNTNYIILGRIIEKVSGQSYAAFIKNKILDPLGLADTGYEDGSTLIKHRAAGYRHGPETMTPARYMDMSNAYAAGGLYSTPEDLVRWDQALATEKILSKRSLDEIFTPGKGNAGFGWFVDRDGGRPRQMQSGLNSGFASAMYRFPDERVAIILLSNVEDTATHLGRIGHDLAAITFGEKYEVPKANVEIKVDADKLRKLVGQYDFGPGRIITVSLQNGGLFSQRANEPAFEMFAESETRFFLKVADVRFEFQTGEAGAVLGVMVRANGRAMPGRKVR